MVRGIPAPNYDFSDGDLRALLVAERQLLHLVAGAIGDAQALQQGVRAAGGPRAAEPGEAGE